MDPSKDILARNLNQLNVGGATRRQLESHQPSQIDLTFPPTGIPQLCYQGHHIYDSQDALAKTNSEINNFLQNPNPDLIVFFGLGMGWHAQFLRKKTQAPIIIFEPGFDILAAVLPKFAIDVDNITLVTNTGHLVEVVGQYLTAVSKNMATGAITAYRDLFPTEFDDFCAALVQALNKIDIDQKTKAFFTTDWITHTRDNLPTLIYSKPLQVLGRIFAGKPGILVGAGPSLDKNIEVLKKVQNHALICAVHSAVMPLSKAGITPDIVVIIEGTKLDYYFQDISNIGDSILAPGPQTHPIHLDLGFKDILSISTSEHMVSDWLERAYQIVPLQSGGSVACTVFSMLHQLGCDPIILVGMDCAYTEGRTHASEAQAGCCRVDYSSETNDMSVTYLDGRVEGVRWDSQHVTAWSGKGKVMTRPIYSSYRHWFESAGQTWASDRTLINATEGGARFHGFQEMTLADVRLQYFKTEFPASQWIETAIRTGEKLKPHLLGQAIRDELDIVKETAAKALKAEKAATKALRLLQSGQLSSLQPVLDILGQHETHLRNLTRQTRMLNTLIGHRSMALSTEPPTSNDKISLTIYSVEKSREISRLILDGANELETIFAPLATEFLSSDPTTR